MYCFAIFTSKKNPDIIVLFSKVFDRLKLHGKSILIRCTSYLEVHMSDTLMVLHCREINHLSLTSVKKREKNLFGSCPSIEKQYLLGEKRRISSRYKSLLLHLILLLCCTSTHYELQGNEMCKLSLWYSL